ncbi:MAG: hypothetical protein ACR2MN_08565 [Acidimicrobiales bacterium]
MTEQSCEQFRAAGAELALGILDGWERADAMAHLEHCPACHRELVLMADLADRLVELTPGAEPPAGFETRVLASLTSRTRSPPRRRIAVVLAAAALAFVVGIGGWVVGHRGTAGGPSLGGDRVATAAFVTGSHQVGQVIATPGPHPWIFMAVDTGLGDQTIVCQIRERGGATVTLGSFPLSNGYGYWGAPIPPGSTLSGAQLIDARGRIIATASLPTPPSPAVQ